MDTQSSIPFIADYAGPGYFNDLDMLIVGNMSSAFYDGSSKLTADETRAHVALWAILKSPMLLSCDIRSLDEATLALLTNDDMIKISQDPLAKQAVRIATGAGNPVPQRVQFLTCPHLHQDPLARQTWQLQSDGKIVSTGFADLALMLRDCDADGRGQLQLCNVSSQNGLGSLASVGCNTTCPTANIFSTKSTGGARMLKSAILQRF